MGLVGAFTALLFSVEGFAGLALAAVLVCSAIGVSRVPWRLALRGLRAIAFILGFTLLAHGLRWNPATTALVRLGPLAIDETGLLTGAFFSLRIVLLVMGTSVLTLTTSPVQLTDGIERLMKPLAYLHVPVGDLAMMLTVALRFIPTTAEEAEKIIFAQAARGARFDRGGPIARARAYVPVLVPLFVNLFRRADELATAMETRCYRGGHGRTRLHESRMQAADWVVLALGVCVMTLGTVIL